MKAAPFDYLCAQSLPHALAALAETGDEAKLIAGGQSLVPMMAMRLATPTLLIDINRLTDLQRLDVNPGTVTTGAALRQCVVEDTDSLCTPLPLLKQALRWVGHRQTRNRGTVGGSLAHADPSAELPLAALVLGTTMRLRSDGGGERAVTASEFFVAALMSAVSETECLVEIEWPVWDGIRIGAAFDETAIRHGDFAIASAACQLQLDAAGNVSRVSFGLGAVDATPLVFPELAQQLLGQRLTPALAEEVAKAAARHCDPADDIHASAQYRRHLAAVSLQRVLLQAARDAASEPVS